MPLHAQARHGLLSVNPRELSRRYWIPGFDKYPAKITLLLRHVGHLKT